MAEIEHDLDEEAYGWAPQETPDETAPVEAKRRIRIAAPWGRGDHPEIALHALAEAEGDGPPIVHDEGVFSRYDESTGTWTNVDEAYLSRIVQSFAGTVIDGEKKPLRIRYQDVRGAIACARDRCSSPGFFTQAPAGVAFADGFVEVTAERLTLHKPAPEHRARFAYPFTFGDALASSAWGRFLHDIFRDDEDREERIALLGEFFGACLLGIAPRFQRCLFTVADGGAGRSTLLQVITGCFPPGSIVAIAPHDLTHEYKRALLAGRLLNAVAELPEADILASDAFKALVTGDMTTAREPCKPAFSFWPRAGHFFSTNRLPATSDQTLGFWSRIIVLKFSRRFRTEGTADLQIAEQLLATEKPAIVRWLLEGARRLIAQGGYTVPASHAAALARWQRESNPVAMFLAERTKPVEKPWEPATDLYTAFDKWAKANGHKGMSSTLFGRRMRELGKESRSDGTARRYPVRLLLPTESPDETTLYD